MALRPGGLDPITLQQAIERYARTSSMDELAEAIEADPTLRSPVFHAGLRQEMIRLRNERRPELEPFTQRYREFFFLLDSRRHAQLCRAAAASAPPPAALVSAAGAPSGWLPPFFAELRRLLGARVPASSGRVLDPAADPAAITQELGAAVGGIVNLPSYAPWPGWRGAAIAVRCASCQRERVEFKPYAVELVRTPELAAQLDQGQLRTPACPGCGEPLCTPVRTWIEEMPGTSDDLMALSCAWRFGRSYYVYVPPAGTRRDEEHDRVLEVRFSLLLDRLGWPEQEAGGAASATSNQMAVAYDPEELRHIARGAAAEAAGGEGGPPPPMRTLIGEHHRKVTSGLLPLHVAIASVRQLARELGASWPLIVPHAADFPGDALELLLWTLAAEGVAEARGAPMSTRVLVATAAVTAFLGTGHVTMAEQALARADELLEGTPADDQRRDLARLAIADARAGFLNAVGKHNEAAELRRSVESAGLLESGSLQALVARQHLQCEQALALYDRGLLPSALAALSQALAAGEALRARIEASADPAAPSLLRALDRDRSGTLANTAAVLTDLLDSDNATRSAAAPLLASWLPDGSDRHRALEQIRELLERALALAEQVESHDFAAVQAHRLASVHGQLGHVEAAVAAAHTAIAHAMQAGDATRIWSSYAFLADQALARRDGAAALDLLRSATREWIRGAVRSGEHARRGPEVASLADGAFQAVAHGGAAAEAILVVESLKAAVLGASLARDLVSDVAPPGLARDARVRRDLDLARGADDTDVALIDAASLARRMERLGPRATLIGGQPGSGGLWGYALWTGGALVEHCPFEPDRSGPAASPCAVPAAAQGQPGAATRHARPIATPAPRSASLDRLLDALSPRLIQLAPDDRVLISPWDGAWTEPWASLPWNGRLLSQIATLSYIQGVDVLESCLARTIPPLEEVLCIGDPDRPGTAPLPHAEAEARDLASVFAAAGKRGTMLVHADATVAKLRSHGSHAALIHFACHADLGPDGIMRLLLAPDPDAADDGDLTEDRILSGLALSQGVIINLAACSSGAQGTAQTPLYGGLVPAFLRAGASNVIATLWPIHDALAEPFAKALYQRLLEDRSPASAVASTQRDCVDGKLGPELRDTHAWAAYVVWGAG